MPTTLKLLTDLAEIGKANRAFVVRSLLFHLDCNFVVMFICRCYILGHTNVLSIINIKIFIDHINQRTLQTYGCD